MIHLSRYKLFTKNFEIINPLNPKRRLRKASRYDYLPVLSDDKEIIKYSTIKDSTSGIPHRHAHPSSVGKSRRL